MAQGCQWAQGASSGSGCQQWLRSAGSGWEGTCLKAQPGLPERTRPVGSLSGSGPEPQLPLLHQFFRDSRLSPPSLFCQEVRPFHPCLCFHSCSNTCLCKFSLSFSIDRLLPTQLYPELPLPLLVFLPKSFKFYLHAWLPLSHRLYYCCS